MNLRGVALFVLLTVFCFDCVGAGLEDAINSSDLVLVAIIDKVIASSGDGEGRIDTVLSLKGVKILHSRLGRLAKRDPDLYWPRLINRINSGELVVTINSLGKNDAAATAFEPLTEYAFFMRMTASGAVTNSSICIPFLPASTAIMHAIGGDGIERGDGIQDGRIILDIKDKDPFVRDATLKDAQSGTVGGTH